MRSIIGQCHVVRDKLCKYIHIILEFMSSKSPAEACDSIPMKTYPCDTDWTHNMNTSTNPIPYPTRDHDYQMFPGML